MLITGAVSSGISKKFIGKVGGKVSRMKTTVGKKKKRKEKKAKDLRALIRQTDQRIPLRY